MPPPHTLVLDTAPLLTNVDIASLGAQRYVTVPEVLGEVRDVWSRRSLQFQANYTLETKVPDEGSMKAGT
jgi:hypothetical protein